MGEIPFSLFFSKLLIVTAAAVEVGINALLWNFMRADLVLFSAVFLHLEQCLARVGTQEVFG